MLSYFFPSNSYREGNKRGLFCLFWQSQSNKTTTTTTQKRNQGVVCESGTAPLAPCPPWGQCHVSQNVTGQSSAVTMHLACLEKPSNLRSGHFCNISPAGAARMRMSLSHGVPAVSPQGRARPRPHTLHYVRMLEMNSLKRFEYCSGFTVEISAPAPCFTVLAACAAFFLVS